MVQEMGLTSRWRSFRQNGRLRQYANDSAWGFGLEAFSLVGSLLSFMLLGRTLGAAGYGEYASLYAIIGPLVTLAASGVVLALLQHVVRDGEPLEETVRSCLSLTVLLGLSLTVVGGIIALRIVGSLGALAIFSILLIEFVTLPIMVVAATTVQSQGAFAASMRIRMTLAVGRVVVLLVLYFTGNLTVASFGVSQLAISIVLGSVALYQVSKLYGIRALPGRVRLKHLRSNVNYSVAISADAVGNDGDKVVLAASGYTVDTGLYAAAYRIIGLGQIPVGVLVSMSHKRFLENDEARRREHLDLALRYSFIAGTYGIVFGVVVYLTAPWFPLVMGSEFEGSVEILRWLAPIVFLRAIGIFSLNGLMGLGRVVFRTVVITGNAAVGVVLYLILIPSRGWQGAVMASIIVEAAQVIMTWTALVVCQRIADRKADELETVDAVP